MLTHRVTIHRPLRNAITKLAAFGLLLPSLREARAQGLLRTYFGDQQSGNFGISVANAGDVDADGRDDAIVGAYLEDHGSATNAGSARVLSGLDGSLLWDFDGAALNDELGWSVAAAGDVNGDGFADVIVGAWRITAGVSDGYFRVFSGKDGTKFHEKFGDNNKDFLGSSVAGLGDVNGDGLSDFAAGMPGHDSTLNDTGSIRVYSGADGSTLYTVSGTLLSDQLGRSLARIGDLDGDGVDDFVGGMIKSVGVYSGANGALLRRIDGNPSDADDFGCSVGAMQDVDGDAIPDLIVGANTAGGRAGAAYVYSGADFSLIHTVTGETGHDFFGTSVAGCGDCSGDGVPDFIVGALQELHVPSYAKLFSGRDGRLLYRFDGYDADEDFGFACAGAGDVDRDGFDDVVVGAPGAFKRVGREGSVSFFGGNDLWLQAVPGIVYLGNPVELDVRNGPAGGTSILFLTAVDTLTTFGLVVILPLDGFGEAAIGGTVPNELLDIDFTFRAYAVGPTGSHGPVLVSGDEVLSVR